jgi:Leucine-rich repeat (LRR) protein
MKLDGDDQFFYLYMWPVIFLNLIIFKMKTSLLSIFFMCSACFATFNSLYAQVNKQDSLALVDLYNSTNGPTWHNHSNWLTTAPVGIWHGITVVANSVTAIHLDNNNMSGPLPASIGDLTALKELDLSNDYNEDYYNYITGSIPASIGKCISLEKFYMMYNFLTGSIPASIGNCINLKYVSLLTNGLSGSIPPEIGNCTKLESLDLSGNKLSMDITASLGNCINLQTLNLSFNPSLAGTIPEELGNCVNLKYLDIASCQISGTIPASLSNCKNLQTLYLYSNQLSGSIPASIGSCTNLTSLWLYNNKLTGRIPSSLGRLALLETLKLNNNQLTGAIPASFGQLVSLNSMDVSFNRLIYIPSAINNCTNLKYLNISSNKMRQKIPEIFTHLLNLQYLYLSYNQFHGSLPGEIGNAINLQYLYMDHNRITGNIPGSIGSLSKLSNLDLSYNQISGAIPSQIGNITKLNSLALNNNNLSNSIPAQLGDCKYIDLLYLNNNHLSDTVPMELVNMMLSIYEMDLSHNQLSGDAPTWLFENGSASFAHKISLNNNQFTSLPDIVLTFGIHLDTLLLNNNLLAGPIPSSFNVFNSAGYIALQNNYYTFDEMEPLADDFYYGIKYNPQANIPLHKTNNALSVSAGGTLSLNQYSWYKVGNSTPTIVRGDSVFYPTQDGDYYVNVRNRDAIELTLRSDTVSFTVSGLLPSNNIRAADEAQKNNEDVFVYPNPVKSNLNIHASSDYILSFKIINASCVIVQQQIFPEKIKGDISVRLNFYNSGTYFIELQTGNGSITKKFIKE